MHTSAFLNLDVGFSKYFSAVPAITDELKHKAYQIRHEVYCKEMSFEPVTADAIETDPYDEHSVHCLLRSNADGEYIGCVRLIVASGEPGLRLPFEIVCESTLDPVVLDPAELRRDSMAEVSRLAVISRYRRRQGESKRPADINDSDFGTSDRPRFPYITVGLYLGMLAQAHRYQIDSLFAVTEAKLARHLSRLGISMQPIGAPVEHHGTRLPWVIRVNDVIDGFSASVRPLYEVIAREIDDAYRNLQ